MASGGYGRGGRGAALLQALSQPARKPGDNGQDSAEKVPIYFHLFNKKKMLINFYSDEVAHYLCKGFPVVEVFYI